MASAVADWPGVSLLEVGYEVTLSGVVAGTAEHDAALAAATEVKGHESIDDQLEVQTDLDEARLNELVGLEPVVFDSNNATIETESFAVLDAAVEVLAATTGDVVIEGHTDTRGAAETNRALSEARAIAVVDYLISKGVVADRVTAIGYGEERPLVEPDDNSRGATGQAAHRIQTLTTARQPLSESQTR
jgi:outer membrane protein OmpA-like peptidoglycan-associated protein